MDLIKLMIEVNKRLDEASKSIFKLAKEKAEAEREYRKALAQEYLILKSEGTSVTLIPDIARGRLADLMFQRDASDAMFTAARESLGALQTQASLLQSILKYQEVI